LGLVPAAHGPRLCAWDPDYRIISPAALMGEAQRRANPTGRARGPLLLVHLRPPPGLRRIFNDGAGYQPGIYEPDLLDYAPGPVAARSGLPHQGGRGVARRMFWRGLPPVCKQGKAPDTLPLV